MKPRLPKTLKTRAVGIFFVILIASQLFSLLLYEHNRERTIILTEATDLADRIIGIVSLARGFPGEDRQRILAAAETQFLTMFPDIVSIDEVACQDNDFSRRMSGRIGAALDQHPGFSAQVCVRDLDKPQFFKAGTALRGFDVLLFINFPDNEQTVFHTILPEGTSLLEDPVILYLVLVGVLALILGWYLIKKAIAPLERLAKAADEFGINIDKPPMNDEGPLEVSRAAQAFNRMQMRLSRLIHSQTDMLAAISHDLRSTITRLQLRVELLQDQKERESLLTVVTDMKQMVQSVLDFVRGYNPREPIRRVNITALVESLCDDLSEEGFAVKYRCEIRDVSIACRVTAFRRGLQNVINNAIIYGDSAEISVYKEQDELVIAVDDNGPGIPEQELESVVQPFYRLDRSRGDKTPGIGLGLSITQNMVQSLGGSLVLVNRKQGGLRVMLRIPTNNDKN